MPYKVTRIIVAADTDKKELKAIISSMIVDHNNGTLSCEICGKVKEMKDGKMPFAKLDMSRHIESHIDGISFPCHHCGKISKNRRTHKLHTLNMHSKHRYSCSHCKKSLARFIRESIQVKSRMPAPGVTGHLPSQAIFMHTSLHTKFKL